MLTPQEVSEIRFIAQEEAKKVLQEFLDKWKEAVDAMLKTGEAIR